MKLYENQVRDNNNKKLRKEIKIAREQVKRGECYTDEEVRQKLGL